MPRFFLPSDAFSNGGENEASELVIRGEDAFHLASVLRVKPGEEVVACSASGTEFFCAVSEILEERKNCRVLLTIKERRLSENEPKTAIRVFQGMPKGKKTDLVIQKCVELGAGEIFLVYSDRSVPLRDGEGDAKKRARFQKIADEAAKQCGRGKLVKVGLLPSFDEALKEMEQSQTRFVCFEAEEERSVKEEIRKPCESLSFFVGPEGGLSQRELLLCRGSGIPSVSLGKRILRTETCAAAVLSMILYEKEL